MLHIISHGARLGGDATYCRKISQGEDTEKTCLSAGTVANNYQLPGCLMMSASKKRLKYHFYVKMYQFGLTWKT